MDISIDSLKDIYKKYQGMKEKLEEKLKEINTKLNTLSQIFELLKEEGFLKEQISHKINPLSEKYANMTKREAIKDVLKSNQEEWWIAKKVLEQLQSNGFQTKSKNLLRDVYGELNRLEKKGEIISNKDFRPVRYKIKLGEPVKQKRGVEIFSINNEEKEKQPSFTADR